MLSCDSRRRIRIGTTMAIKFVDKESEGAGKSRKADMPSVKREPDAKALEKSVEPELSHPQPEPKKRGRK